jgi:hypothetical protein
MAMSASADFHHTMARERELLPLVDRFHIVRMLLTQHKRTRVLSALVKDGPKQHDVDITARHVKCEMCKDAAAFVASVIAGQSKDDGIDFDVDFNAWLSKKDVCCACTDPENPPPWRNNLVTCFNVSCLTPFHLGCTNSRMTCPVCGMAKMVWHAHTSVSWHARSHHIPTKNSSQPRALGPQQAQLTPTASVTSGT